MGYTTMDAQAVKIKPRLIIHGGAGNIQRRSEFPPEKYEAYRYALISIVGFIHHVFRGILNKQN